MPGRKTLDRRPGTMPEILADGDSITFRMDIADVGPGEQLIIRCESNGMVWVAIPDNTHSPEE